MKATKLELQQTINRLAADNQFLREKLSVLTTDYSRLQAKLDDADHRARKLIAARNHGNSARRAAMEEARRIAMTTGKLTDVVSRVSGKGGVQA
jgi:septal ring factor EnvC (AmiA/AmiB activator)